jgi:hypothetical protein
MVDAALGSTTGLVEGLDRELFRFSAVGLEGDGDGDGTGAELFLMAF